MSLGTPQFFFIVIYVLAVVGILKTLSTLKRSKEKNLPIYS